MLFTSLQFDLKIQQEGKKIHALNKSVNLEKCAKIKVKSFLEEL
jgi:hypothetical protein